jgi:hypothetical protein
MGTSVPAPTLLDLVSTVYEMTDSREEAADVINHLFATGRVRLPGLAVSAGSGGSGRRL